MIFKQKIFQLQITMNDAIFVEIINGREHISHELGSAVFAEDEALVLSCAHHPPSLLSAKSSQCLLVPYLSLRAQRALRRGKDL